MVNKGKPWETQQQTKAGPTHQFPGTATTKSGTLALSVLITPPPLHNSGAYLVFFVYFSMMQRRANWASLVMWSASSRITNLTPELRHDGTHHTG